MEGFPSGQREQTVNLPSTTSVVRIHLPPPTELARMAELADALDSGSSGVTPVQVQVLFLAPSQESLKHCVSGTLIISAFLSLLLFLIEVLQILLMSPRHCRFSIFLSFALIPSGLSQPSPACCSSIAQPVKILFCPYSPCLRISSVDLQEVLEIHLCAVIPS